MQGTTKATQRRVIVGMPLAVPLPPQSPPGVWISSGSSIWKKHDGNCAKEMAQTAAGIERKGGARGENECKVVFLLKK